MTPEAILNAIHASPDLQALMPDHAAIAAALSAGRVRLTSTLIGNGLVLQTLGFEIGNALLDTVATSPELRHVAPILAAGNLDVSQSLVRETLGQLTDAASAAKLLALAEVPDPVSEFSVRCAIYADNGELLV